MKKLLYTACVFMLLFFSKATVAQGYDNYIGDTATHVTGMGGPIFGFSSIHGNFAFFMGGAGGMVIHDVTIGVFGLGQTTQVTDWTSPDRYISMSCGGIWLGYAFWAKSRFHPSVDVLAGIGSVSTFYKNSYTGNNSDRNRVYFITPRIGVEFNASDYIRISVGAEYRSIGFMKPNDYYSNADFSSPGAFITMKIGGF